jgi:hypothetical protein
VTPSTAYCIPRSTHDGHERRAARRPLSPRSRSRAAATPAGTTARDRRGHRRPHRRSTDGGGEAATPSILERLGDPSEIAAEARERFDIKAPRPGWTEVGALILLPVGAFIVPIVGWIAGVVLLWSSAVWSTRDKLLGTFVLPGGLLPVVLLVTGVASVSVCDESSVTDGARVISTTSTCTSGPSTLETFGWIVLAGALLVMPIVTAIHLASKRRAAATAAL